MADAALLAADSNICAACFIACTEAIWSFCLLKPYGSNPNRTPCGGTRGCCGSCFQKGFDEDEFDKAERRADEKRQKENERNARNAQTKEPNELKDNSEPTPESVSAVGDKGRVNDERKKTPPPNIPDIVIHQPTPVSTMNNRSAP